MSEDNHTLDAQIIHTAYAERVKDAFKVFAENLAMGENEKTTKDRFLRALELTRKARDMAIDVLNGISMVEPEAPLKTERERQRDAPLTAEQQAVVDQVLAGTTGQKAAPPPSPMRR